MTKSKSDPITHQMPPRIAGKEGLGFIVDDPLEIVSIPPRHAGTWNYGTWNYATPLPCDGTRTGTGSRCDGRGWYEGEEADIYCSCAAGERLRKSE